jgi:hypothetical protein
MPLRSKQDIDRAKERNKRGALTRSARLQKSKIPHHGIKHDWLFIKNMYMAGMEKGDLLKLPECAALSHAYLSRKMYSERWPQERRNLQHKVKSVMGLTLHEQIAQAGASHYQFMLKELADERQIIASRMKTTNMADQKERLDLIVKLEGLVRKTLGLDDMTPGDSNKNSYNVMISIHQGEARRNGSVIEGAILPLPENKKVIAVNPERLQGISLEELGEDAGENRAWEHAGQDQAREVRTAEPSGLARLSAAIILSPEDILRSHRMKDTKKP